MAPELEELTALEILELGDGGTLELRPIQWKLGQKFIKTVTEPDGKTIKVLRVWLNPIDKQLGPNYWDITSQTLITQLLPYLESQNWRGRIFKITKHGVAPRARFTLEVL